MQIPGSFQNRYKLHPDLLLNVKPHCGPDALASAGKTPGCVDQFNHFVGHQSTNQLGFITANFKFDVVKNQQ